MSSSSRADRTPLRDAAENGHANAIRVRIAHGADPNSKTKGGMISRHVARGGSETVETLIALGAKMLATDDSGATPLHAFAAADQTDGVKALLAARCPVDIFDKAQRTPLHLGCRCSDNRDVVSSLLSAGAYANAPDAEGLRPLHEACKHGDVQLIETLREFGAEGSGSGLADRALLAACEGRGGGSGGGDGSRRDGREAPGGALLDMVMLLVGPRGGARPTHDVFRALWRNGKLGGWEMRAVHAVLNEVAEPGLRRDEAEWLIVKGEGLFIRGVKSFSPMDVLRAL